MNTDYRKFNSLEAGDKTPEHYRSKKEALEVFKLEAKKHMDNIRDTLRITSLVMVTSTIGTYSFLIIPICCISDLNIRSSFLGESSSIAMNWGVVFSLTLLFMGIFSFHYWNKVTERNIRDANLHDSDNILSWKLEEKDIFSLVSNVGFIYSSIAPLAASLSVELILNL